MLRFAETAIRGGKLEVTGPFEGNPDALKHVRFVVSQRDTMVEGAAKVEPATGNWTGTTSANRLEPGGAHAIGLAVLVHPGPPPRFETFTWAERVELTG
jgi:hypothetical protein